MHHTLPHPSQMFAAFEPVAQQWLQALSAYTLQDLLNKPSEGEWSIGQVYMHLIGAGQGFFMKYTKMCIRGEGTETDEPMNDQGQLLFKLGGFPDQKFGMPTPVAQQPPQPESIEFLANALKVQIQKMGELAKEMEGYAANQKIQHPRFGMVNAGEWYIMNEWHFAHHLRQKARIDAYLQTQH